MNGFEVAAPVRPGLLERFRHRPLKENALIELQNIVAQKPLMELPLDRVQLILDEYGLAAAEAHTEFLKIYTTVFTHCISDMVLPPDARAGLARLRQFLRLHDEEAAAAERVATRLQYERLLRTALETTPSSSVRAKLDPLAEALGVSADGCRASYTTEARRIVQKAFDQALATGRLAPTEDARLQGLGEALGVTLIFDAAAQAKADRARLLGRIASGDLPTIAVDVILQRGEVCHAQLRATLHEMRTVTTRYQYSGPVVRIPIMKHVSWRVGSIAVHPIQKDTMTLLDQGTLFITNKRLLFHGAKKTTTVALKKVIAFTVHADGLKIEKDTGKPQYYVGSGDLELVGSILDAALKGISIT
jgi:hypothetical protein